MPVNVTSYTKSKMYSTLILTRIKIPNNILADANLGCDTQLIDAIWFVGMGHISPNNVIPSLYLP